MENKNEEYEIALPGGKAKKFIVWVIILLIGFGIGHFTAPTHGCNLNEEKLDYYLTNFNDVVPSTLGLTDQFTINIIKEITIPFRIYAIPFLKTILNDICDGEEVEKEITDYSKHYLNLSELNGGEINGNNT